MPRALLLLVAVVSLAAFAHADSPPGQPSSPPGNGGQDASQRVESPPADVETLKAALAAGQKLFGEKDYAGLRGALLPLTRSEFPEVAYPSMFWVARSYIQQKLHNRAIPLLRKVAAGYDPLAAQAHYWLGQAYIRKRRYATARKWFRHGPASPEDALADDCMYYVGYTLYVDRHYELACEAFETFLAKYPESRLTKSATRLLERSRKRLREARKVTVGWVANLGIASSFEQVALGQSEFGVGANARIGGNVRWEPRDGVRMSANAYGTRTSYLTGDLGDRQGIVAGLSMSQDLGDLRALSYGLSYSENQRVEIATSDSRTRGLWTSFRAPLSDTATLSLFLHASDLKYYRETSSGSQYSVSASYSDRVSDSVTLGLGSAFTTSRVGADYLSYDAPGLSASLTKRFTRRRSARAGIRYTARNFDAPRPRRDTARSDRQRVFYAEYSQRVSDRLTITVGWRENSRTSTEARLTQSDPSWYVRTTSLLDVKF